MGYATRRVEAHEWKQLRELRLAALADTPIGFGMWHGDALNLPDEYWQEKTRRDAVEANSALFIAVDAASGEWVGMAGGFVAEETSHYWQPGQEILVVFSVYVDPAHRGRERGVNVLLFDDVLAWAAAAHPGAQDSLGVHEHNVRAHAFYRRYGFVDTGRSIPYNLDVATEILLMDYRPVAPAAPAAPAASVAPAAPAAPIAQ